MESIFVRLTFKHNGWQFPLRQYPLSNPRAREPHDIWRIFHDIAKMLESALHGSHTGKRSAVLGRNTANQILLYQIHRRKNAIAMPGILDGRMTQRSAKVQQLVGSLSFLSNRYGPSTIDAVRCSFIVPDNWAAFRDEVHFPEISSQVRQIEPSH